MRRARRSIGVGVVGLLLASDALTSEPGEVTIRSSAYVPPVPRISAQSNLVQSGVTVYDSRGRPVAGLKSSDFTLQDNGKAQSISVFSELRRSASTPGSSNQNTSPETERSPARSVALFFDDMHLTSAGLPLYRKAAEKLLAAGLPPGERMGIFTDSGTVTVGFTTDAKALLAALPQIKSHRDPAERGMTTCPTLTAYSAFVIKEHIDEGEKEAAVKEVMGCDCRSGAICRILAEGKVMDMAEAVWDNSRHYATTTVDVLKLLVAHLAKQEGERVLVMVSGGFPDDERMKPERNAIIDAALRGHVVLNSLAVESQMGFRQLVLTNTMVEAASATGGRVIRNTNDFDGALGALATAPEVSYLMGFQAGEPDGSYHTLKFAVRNSAGLKVEARPGYFAAAIPKEGATAQERIDTAVRSKAPLNSFPVSARVNLQAQKSGGYRVGVTIDIDAKRLRFAAQSGLHLQQLTFVTAIEDETGNFIAGKQAVMDLRLKPTTLTSMQASGIHAVETFSLPRGAYTVRGVVRELVQDRISASNTSIRLP